MRTLRLGDSGLAASTIGLGCSRLGSILSGTSGAAAERLVRGAIDAGVTLLDTADIYGQGDSERLVGSAVRGQRDRVVIVTKAGQRFAETDRAVMLAKRPLRHAVRLLPGLRAALAERRAHALPRDYRAQYIQRGIEASLRRLRTDTIDIFLLHSPTVDDVRRGLAFEMLDDLARSGAIRVWGVSCDDVDTLEAALQVPSVRVVQVPLRLAAGDAAPSLAAAAGRGVGILVRELFAAIEPASDLREARRRAVVAALSIPGAAALVGTTNFAHLREVLDIAWRTERSIGPAMDRSMPA
jgi:aryl-alcohol dehydrogenase-like predicted oxidoreductase